MTGHLPDPQARAVLFVDDEPHACKWFARGFGDEFAIRTATSVAQALEVLRSHAQEIAVLVTDYRMPGRDGLDLLRAAQQDHRYVIRLLASAHADKDVTIAAVNEGQVYRILEKPLQAQATRQALRDALDAYQERAVQRVLHESRAASMRDTLGFLAHELNTPLATVDGCVTALQDRLHPDGKDVAGGVATVQMTEHRAGEVAAALEAAQRSARHCRSLVSTFVQSARDAYSGAQAHALAASALVQALLNEYPFRAAERTWVKRRVDRDFVLSGRRDLLYLALCTLVKNALAALRGRTDAALHIVVGCDERHGRTHRWIRFEDNGPGIAPELLARLTREPATTKMPGEGSGMGLIFCRRVLQSIGGSIDIASKPGQGTTVTLHFDSSAPARAHAIEAA